MKKTFRIAEICFGSPIYDAAFQFEMQGSLFECQRFGANYSVDYMKALINQLSKDVDAIALSEMPASVKVENQSYEHSDYLRIMSHPSQVLLDDGSHIRSMLSFKVLSQLVEEKLIKVEQGVLFPFALRNIEIEEYIRRHCHGRVLFADALTRAGIPILWRPHLGLLPLAKAAISLSSFSKSKTKSKKPFALFDKLSNAALRLQTGQYQYVLDDMASILPLANRTELIEGKDLLVYSHHPVMEKELVNSRPRSVIHLFPKKYLVSPYMNYSLLQACLRLLNKKETALDRREWEDLLSDSTLSKQVTREYTLSRSNSIQKNLMKKVYQVKNHLVTEKPPDFAFIVHALSHQDFQMLPVVGPLIRMLPDSSHARFNQLASKAPPLVYGHIKNIRSDATGREVNGILYVILTVPKILKESDPEVTYKKIDSICYDAASRGAKLIGLGAYTKMIGDFGVTINNESPIPVTTGNSLSASATLWALNDVVKKMNLIQQDKNSGLYTGQAMVIGATGSIGKVSAKLLAYVFKKLILVAPNLSKLEDVRREILITAPRCEIIITTNANDFAHSVDALVTATSAFDQQIIDVMRLKPGCVVCDCSRPLDFSADEARKRPDVLIIESGEVDLPGPVSLTCDLGLPGRSVYACLAETAVLALEQRYEAFTLGRDIDWKKVKEIYKLSLKHGVRLSAIQGHLGLVTEKEMQLTRQIALSRLMNKP